METEFLCQECRELSPSFDRVCSALRFDAEARRMVLDYKFNRHLWLTADFVDWLEAAAYARLKVGEIDMILPMPTAWWHRFDRGYNQCHYLAKGFSKRIERPMLTGVIGRVGWVRRQGGLSEEERRENAKGSFKVRKPKAVDGKTVLVVDDIMTTGSTLSECARVLKLAGASRVWCLTLAHTIRD